MKDSIVSVQDLIRKGFEARRNRDYPLALEHLQHARSEAQRLKDSRGEASALVELSAVMVDFNHDYNGSREALEAALKIYFRQYLRQLWTGRRL